ncbi:MAG: AhpC/TSA family protein [Proteobacteria bacterium]|nr:AhpC/TSA family protein [Pseudomonadota bacterium]MCH8278458.1 AhpC/TSA family protein [Pseudomonadota bacterium]
MKSIFVSFYMMAAIVITAIAGQSLWVTRDYLSWGGVLLVTAPFVVFLGRLMIFQNIARTSARFPTLIVLGIAGVVLASWGYARGGSLAAPLLAIVAWVGFVVYSYWYSSFGRQPSEQLQIGNSLPNFELTDVTGQNVSSSSFSDKPTIWIFYRGNWCPLCMAQIKELVADYKELQSRGVRIALISPQPHNNTIALAKRFDAPFAFLTDEGNRAAHALGISHPDGLPMGMQLLGYDSDTVLPTVIITDKGGRVLWAHETDNYRIRPEPGIYLAVLRENGIVADG